ncbi:MAG: sigma-70 family RNA polymerase sigma factor [Thermoanaerobaculia bacterium]|nr:sigma-70 family RNA polymerase sigma factor [Thermoanaerobaculia bacterium]
MEDALGGNLTRLLKEHRAGDANAFGHLVELAHAELERMARQQLRKAPPGRTLDTVALVNEAYLRLFDEQSIDWQSRAHFFGVMARAMRFVVVDHARRHAAGKRGGGARLVTLDSAFVGVAEQAELVLAVHQALEQLETFNERLARIVECRYFAGMNDEEIAAALELSTRTVQRDWLRAQAWLRRALESEPAD